MNLALGLAVVTGLCNAVAALVFKISQDRGCRPLPQVLITHVTICLLCAVLSPWGTVNLHFPLFWLMCAAAGPLYLLAMGSQMASNAYAPPSLVVLISNLALVVPIMLSALFFREKLQGSDLPLLVAFGLMLVLFHRSMQQEEKSGSPVSGKRWGMLTACFLSNGLLLFVFKLKAMSFPQIPVPIFAALTFFFGAVAGSLVVRPWQPQFAFQRRELGYGGLLGVLLAVAINCMVHAMILPATIVFPVVQGISLAGGVALTMSVYRERCSWQKAAGLALAGVVLLMATWR